MGKRTPGKWVSSGNYLLANAVTHAALASFDRGHCTMQDDAQAAANAAYAAAAVRAHDDLCDGLREALDALGRLCDVIDEDWTHVGCEGCAVCFERAKSRGILELADRATLDWQAAHPGEAFEYEVTE